MKLHRLRIVAFEANFVFVIFISNFFLFTFAQNKNADKWLDTNNQFEENLKKNQNKIKEDNLNQIPNNFTIETISSSTVKLKWLPPLNRDMSVLQYKLKYKISSSNNITTISLDSNTKEFVVENLKSGIEYEFRIGAVYLNDNLFFTKWKNIKTFKELDESVVPDQPGSLVAKARTSKIYINWTPPINTSIKIRGYILNYGINFPDINQKELDSSLNQYIIKNLESHKEYVISLKAFNNKGLGYPIYVTAKTLIKEDDEADDLDDEEDNLDNLANDSFNEKNSISDINKSNDLNSKLSLPNESDNLINLLANQETDFSILPPLGVKTDVISNNKMRISWIPTDYTKKSENNSDRFFMVKYNSLSEGNSKGKVRFLNTTENSIFIEDLKPFTKYEIAVKMIQKNQASPWSMGVVNTTAEALPTGAPRDLIVTSISNLIVEKFSNENNLNSFSMNQLSEFLNPSNNFKLNNDLSEIPLVPYTGSSSSSLGKQANFKKAKSAVSKTSIYRYKYKNNKEKNKQTNHDLNSDKNTSDEEIENEQNKKNEDLKSPNTQNYIQELNAENDIKSLTDNLDKADKFDKQQISLTKTNLATALPRLSAVSLSWQPAKQVNGETIGYLISYSRNLTLPNKEWEIHQVYGDHRSTIVRNLLPETIYYFKAQVRNKKGIGPYSSPVKFRTTSDNSTVSTNTLYLIIIIISSISLLLFIVISSLLCKSKKNQANPINGNNIYSDSPLSKHRTNSFLPHSPLSASNTLKSNKNRDFLHPDLWINHDPIELNKLDKNLLNEELSIMATPILQRMETFLGRDGI